MAVTRLLLPDSIYKLPNTRDLTLEDGESWKEAGDKINAGLTRTGLTEIEFGAYPGVLDTTLVISGQDDIAATAAIDVFIQRDPTDDHSADEHVLDPPRVIAGNISAGVGFTIYGITQTNQPVYGKWTVAWRWSN